MGVSRALPLALGACAVASGAALVALDVIFAVTLSQSRSPSSTRVTAIVASGVGLVTVCLLVVLLGKQIRYRNGAHIQDFGHGRLHTYLLAGFGGVSGLWSAVASAVVLAMMRNRVLELPHTILGSSTKRLVTGGFLLWAVALTSQALFMICLVIIQRKDFQQQIQPYQPEDPRTASEMQQPSIPQTQGSSVNTGYRGSSSMDSKTTPPSSSGRSRAGSDAMGSLRSSFHQVVRPITSKTKLINQKNSHRPPSTDSSHRDTKSIEDGFDSWDTSAVDAQARHAVESASPTPPHFLETIPASPATSRSASPGFPLNLEPPRRRERSRSYSPATSVKDLPKSRTTSPVDSPESHIHPLFRTDSPTPAPAATPGTIVTAAPGAGQLISDRASIRSLSRMRSGSLPSSPMMSHSPSLDSIRRAMEKEEREAEALHEEALPEEEAEIERTITPPIPDWIMTAGARSSLSGYNSRKKGLGIVVERK